jgi:hypothetical protein
MKIAAEFRKGLQLDFKWELLPKMIGWFGDYVES